MNLVNWRDQWDLFDRRDWMDWRDSVPPSFPPRSLEPPWPSFSISPPSYLADEKGAGADGRRVIVYCRGADE